MDGKYLSYIFGINFILVGTFTIYRLFRKRKENGNKFARNKAIWLPIGIILIGNGFYDLINPGNGRYSIGNNDWTFERKQILVETCLRDAATRAEKYPEILKTYCECSIEKIIQKQTYSEYVDNLKKPQEQQVKIIMPIIKDCYDTMQAKIRIENGN